MSFLRFWETSQWSKITNWTQISERGALHHAKSRGQKVCRVFIGVPLTEQVVRVSASLEWNLRKGCCTTVALNHCVVMARKCGYISISKQITTHQRQIQGYFEQDRHKESSGLALCMAAAPWRRRGRYTGYTRPHSPLGGWVKIFSTDILQPSVETFSFG